MLRSLDTYDPASGPGSPVNLITAKVVRVADRLRAVEPTHFGLP